MLPDMVNGSRIRKSVQTAFGGYDRRPDAADGTLFDTEGLTTDKTPLLGTREKRWELSTGGTTYHAVCVLGGDQIVWIRNDGLVRMPEFELCMLTSKAQRSMTRFGKNAIIMPDKLLLRLEYNLKGWSTYANLPTQTATVGDAWLVQQQAGDQIPHVYQFNGTGWDDLGLIAVPLEKTFTTSSSVYIMGSTTPDGVTYDMCRIYIPSAGLGLMGFQVGDGVTISGCTVEPSNNKTAIIRDMGLKSLIFSENTFNKPTMVLYDGEALQRKDAGQNLNLFKATGADYSGNDVYFELPDEWQDGDVLTEEIYNGATYIWQWHDGVQSEVVTASSSDSSGRTPIEVEFEKKLFTGAKEYTEYGGTITITRKLPEMDHIFECSNRLWGCRGSEIFASKLGDPSNFYFFDGTADDSWNLTVESPGDFTGAIAHDGYPTFFKERERYKVFGDIPSQFRTSKLDCVGVRPGAAQSLAIVDGVLFYLARDGIMADNGATPRRISDALGVRSWGTGVSGGCGDTFAICLTQGTASEIFLYDVARGLWLRDSARRVYGFAESGGQLYAIDLTKLICFGVPESITGWTQESAVESLAETNDFTLAEPNSKRVHRVQMRLETELDTVLRILIQYDSDGIWREIAEMIGTGEKGCIRLPVRLRRCDHFRLRFEGVGGWTLHSLAMETKTGSR